MYVVLAKISTSFVKINDLWGKKWTGQREALCVLLVVHTGIRETTTGLSGMLGTGHSDLEYFWIILIASKKENLGWDGAEVLDIGQTDFAMTENGDEPG